MAFQANFSTNITRATTRVAMVMLVTPYFLNVIDPILDKTEALTTLRRNMIKAVT